MKPLNKNIIVEPRNELDEREKETGIALPDHDNVMPDRGKVIAIGPEVEDIEVGDMIVFDRIRVDNLVDKGHKIKIDGKHYLVIPEDLVFGIIS